jgi:hypothetical protein
MIVFDIPAWQLWQLLGATVFPLLVGLATTRLTDGGKKALALAGLSVATSIVTELGAALQAGQEYNLGHALVIGVASFLIAVATHYGLWRPTGVAVTAQDMLVRANDEDLARAEQAKARELVAKAGVAVPATAPADRTPGPDHRADS